MAYDTFLSYSSQDRARAEKVRDHLMSEGLNVWMDRDVIGLGTLFHKSISAGLKQTRTITPILTSSALASTEVFDEVKFGIDNGLKIIPVVLSPQQLLQSEQWRSLLSEIDWGHLDRNALSRNITAEVLADIAMAIRQGEDRRCPILSVYHFKGGVGKTTISAHLAAQLYHSAAAPISVLMIDCDAQSNLSSVFLTRKRLGQISTQSQNLIGMLEPNRLLADQDVFPPYDIAPGTVNDHTIGQVQTVLHSNDTAQKRLAMITNSITATKYGTVTTAQHGQLFQNFQNAIQKLSLAYDLIILDCNPSTTLLSQCALSAATDILVPMRADKYTTDGLENIDELLNNFFKIDFIHGEGQDKKQLWTLVNFADLPHIGEPNQQRSEGRGPEAELLKDILDPLKAGSRLGQFKVSLLDTRIPDSGFLRSKPVETDPLNPAHPPSRSLLRFFSHVRAKPTADAFTRLATEIRSKTRGTARVVSV